LQTNLGRNSRLAAEPTAPIRTRRLPTWDSAPSVLVGGASNSALPELWRRGQRQCPSSESAVTRQMVRARCGPEFRSRESSILDPPRVSLAEIQGRPAHTRGPTAVPACQRIEKS